MSVSKQFIFDTFVKYSPVLILFILWEFLSVTRIIPETFLPSFSSVAGSWYRLLISGDIPLHTAASLWREAVGFALSVLVGTTLGIGMARSRSIDNFFDPLINLIYPIPKSALIPILIVWLGIGHLSKIAVIFLGCILPVVVSSFNGARGVDRFMIWSALNMGTGRRRLLWRVIIPAALPDILSGARTALAISFVLLVSSEMLASNLGLGFLIFFLGEGGDYAGMFATIMTVTLLGFFADRAYLYFMRRILKWREEQAT